MTSTLQSPYTSHQISVWLRGLLTIAWADGHFDIEEQQLITALTHQELTSTDLVQPLEFVSPNELVEALGHDSATAENFLRMAVMVAISDGVYSFCEDELLFQYCRALGLEAEVLQVLRNTLVESSTLETANSSSSTIISSHASYISVNSELSHDVLQPVREWLDKMEIHDSRVAHFLCKMIPSQCPFERDINLFGRKVAHIPALCKINPLYEQLVGLRFRALSYLADCCGEDISTYC